MLINQLMGEGDPFSLRSVQLSVISYSYTHYICIQTEIYPIEVLFLEKIPSQ